MSAEISLSHAQGAFQLDAAFGFSAPGVTALFGHSGAGKSTIIHAIAGLIRPDEGKITVGSETLLDSAQGLCVPAHERRMGVVFQDARLFSHLNVKSNLLYGMRRAKEKPPAEEIGGVVTLLGLAHLLERKPRTLSGGERSRVALGRALLMRPRALLLDEPLAALDAARKSEILPYLERVRDESRIPILYVSHSIDEVARLADRIIVLHEGRIMAQGSLFDVTSNLDLISGGAALPGSILEAVVAAHDEMHALSELSLSGETLVVPALARNIGEKVRVRIDAQDVMLALTKPQEISANNVLPAYIVEVKAGGGPYEDVLLRVGEARLIARITRKSAERLGLKPEQEIFAVIKSVTVGGRE
jgi:molybdate transport system ATP-binding protein